MLTIIHGDNIVSSRNRLFEIREKNKDKEIITFSTPPDKTALIQVLESASLFGADRLVIVENLLTKMGRKKDEIAEYLFKANFSTDCIIWEAKTLTPAVLSHFAKGSKVEVFKLNRVLFRFLESLGVSSADEVLRLYHQCLLNDEIELIFAMLVRQVRILLALNTNAAGLEEMKRLQPWQLGKLKNQASHISTEKLIALHSTLYNLDYEVKTGQNGLSLSHSLDIVLSEF